MDQVYTKILGSMPSAQKKNIVSKKSVGGMRSANKMVGGRKMTSKMVGGM